MNNKRIGLNTYPGIRRFLIFDASDETLAALSQYLSRYSQVSYLSYENFEDNGLVGLNTYPGIRRFLINWDEYMKAKKEGLNTYPGIRRFLIRRKLWLRQELLMSQYLSRYSQVSYAITQQEQYHSVLRLNTYPGIRRFLIVIETGTVSWNGEVSIPIQVFVGFLYCLAKKEKDSGRSQYLSRYSQVSYKRSQKPSNMVKVSIPIQVFVGFLQRPSPAQ